MYGPACVFLFMLFFHINGRDCRKQPSRMRYQIALRLWLKKGCLPWQQEFPRVGPPTLAANSNSPKLWSKNPRIWSTQHWFRASWSRRMLSIPDRSRRESDEVSWDVNHSPFNIQRLKGAVQTWLGRMQEAKLPGTNDDQRSELWGRWIWPKIVLGSLANTRTVFFAEHAHKSKMYHLHVMWC